LRCTFVYVYVYVWLRCCLRLHVYVWLVCLRFTFTFGYVYVALTFTFTLLVWLVVYRFTFGCTFGYTGCTFGWFGYRLFTFHVCCRLVTRCTFGYVTHVTFTVYTILVGYTRCCARLHGYRFALRTHGCLRYVYGLVDLRLRSGLLPVVTRLHTRYAPHVYGYVWLRWLRYRLRLVALYVYTHTFYVTFTTFGFVPRSGWLPVGYVYRLPHTRLRLRYGCYGLPHTRLLPVVGLRFTPFVYVCYVTLVTRLLHVTRLVTTPRFAVVTVTFVYHTFCLRLDLVTFTFTLRSRLRLRLRCVYCALFTFGFTVVPVTFAGYGCLRLRSHGLRLTPRLPFTYVTVCSFVARLHRTRVFALVVYARFTFTFTFTTLRYVVTHTVYTRLHVPGLRLVTVGSVRSLRLRLHTLVYVRLRCV